MSSPRTPNGPRPPTDEKDERGGGRRPAVNSDGPTQVRKVPGFGGEPDIEGALGMQFEETVEVPTGGEGVEDRDHASAAGETDSSKAQIAQAEPEASVIVAEQPLDPNSFEGKLKKQGWTFMRQLGQGGMGTVFLATNDHLEELFVVKMMNPELTGDDAAEQGIQLDAKERDRRERMKKENKERFLNEARAARSVDHRNVVKFGIPFKIDNDMFLPMEYVEGVTLQSRIYRGLMAWETARDILCQICDGMQAIHDAGIIHRDLKPDNLILQKNNGHGEIVKIIDFGLARKESSKRHFATVEGSVMGSPEYMAPEQAKGQKTDVRTDVYAFGVVFYELLTGAPPFERDSDLKDSAWAVCVRIVNEVPESPMERAKDRPITQDVNDIVMKCLEKDPEKRPQTMGEVKAMIMGATGYEIQRPPIVMLTPSLAEAAGRVDPAAHSKPTDQSHQAVELNPGVVVNQSLLLEAGQLEGAAMGDPETTAVVQAPQRQKGTPTMITDATTLRKSRRRLNRALLGGAAALGAAATISMAVYFGSSKAVPDKPVQAMTSTTAREPMVDAGAAVVASRPVQADAAPLAPLTVNRTITFRTNVDGVEVLRGDDSLCTTSGRACSVEVPSGNEEITFTFRRSGFRDAEMGVTPNSDQTLNVRMVAERTSRPGGTTNRPHPPPQQPDDPLLRMQPNYNKKQ